MAKEHESEQRHLVQIQIKDEKINFACLRDKCPASCCGPFTGPHSDLASIEGRKFSDIILTKADYSRLLAAGMSNLVIQAGNHQKMRLLPDGTCCALKDGMCTIHAAKPTVCRAFPFYIDMFVGLSGVTSCPGFGAGWTSMDDLQSEIAAAKKMYEHWLLEIGQDETGPDCE